MCCLSWFSPVCLVLLILLAEESNNHKKITVLLLQWQNYQWCLIKTQWNCWFFCHQFWRWLRPKTINCICIPGLNIGRPAHGEHMLIHWEHFMSLFASYCTWLMKCCQCFMKNHWVESACRIGIADRSMISDYLSVINLGSFKNSFATDQWWS